MEVSAPHQLEQERESASKELLAGGTHVPLSPPSSPQGSSTWEGKLIQDGESHLLPVCQRDREARVWSRDCRNDVNPAPSCPCLGSFPSPRAVPSPAPLPVPQEIQAYRQRSLMEKELLFFSYDVFGIPFVDPVSAAGPGRMQWQMERG